MYAKTSLVAVLLQALLWGVDDVSAASVAMGKSNTNTCSACSCGESIESSDCSKIDGSNRKCYNVIRQLNVADRTCYGAADQMGLNAMVSGVYMLRADCCSPFIGTPFSRVFGEFVVIGVTGVSYQKNHTSGLWQQVGASKPPPMYDFPGLSAVMAGTLGADAGGNWPMYSQGVVATYDNTTCAHRCCVLGLVDNSVVDPSSAECVADWRRCVDVGFNKDGGHFPLCSHAPSATKCTVWVPCSEDEWKLEPMVLLPLATVVLVAAVAWWIYFHDPKVDCGDYFVLVFVCVLPVLSILGLVSSLEFIYWDGATAVDKDYITYQACVAQCNSISNDAAAVLYRFCGDSGSSAAAMSVGKWSIWAEDSNPLLMLSLQTGSCPSHYCSSCTSKIGEVDRMLDLAWFLRIRSYMYWIVIYAVLLDSSHFRMSWLIGCLLNLMSFVAASVLVSRVADLLGARYQINSYAGAMGLPLPSLYDVGYVCAVADAVVFCLYGMGYCVYSSRAPVKNDSNIHVTGPPSESIIPWARIQPVYIRVPNR
jgi:hypothetical protein